MTSSKFSPTEKVAARLIVGIINLFTSAFVAMFVVGGLHDHADARVPDLGYWGALFTVWALSMGGHILRKGFIPEDNNE